MKLNYLFFAVSFIFVTSFPLYAKTTRFNNHVPLDSLAAVVMPIDTIPAADTFTTNIFTTIEAIFGTAGIGMDAHQVETLKKTYLYLIFLTKLEKVQSNILFAQYKTDFSNYLTDNGTSYPFIPDATLVTSAGWLGVVITAQDVQNSKAWQLYTQLVIADIYVYFKIVLETIHNVEKQTFNYIPHFETSFYDADYTNFRTLNEMARTRLVLEDKLKARWVAQCVKWSNLPTVASTSGALAGAAPTQTLESAVVAFRATPYYKILRDPKTIVGTDTTQGVSNSQLLSAPTLKSPLKEQVWCYYMLYEASGQITNFMQASNLEHVLTTCSTQEIRPVVGAAKSSVIPTGSTLMPNIFPYKLDDYVLLDELLSVYSKAEGAHTSSINPSPAQYKIDDLRPADHLQQTYRNYLTEVKAKLATLNASQVKAQSIFSDLGHDFTHAWDDVKSAVEAGYDAVKHFTIAAGQGLAGIGAELVGQTDWASKEFHKEEKTFDKATTDLTKCIDDFGSALKDGIVAPFALYQGTLLGFITDDQKIGADISAVISSVADTLVDVAADTVNVASEGVVEVEQGVFQSMAIASEVAATLAEGAWAIFSQKGRDEFLAEGEQLGKQCLTAIAQAYTIVLKDATKKLFEAVLTGLGTIINAITTLLTDLVREVTFLVTGGIFQMWGLGNLIGLKNEINYAEATRAQVTSALEAHRAVINDVMGVVSCIAADGLVALATAGTGSGSDAFIDAAIMGAEESATATTEATVEAAAEATAAEATATTAQTALEAAQAGVKTVGEKLLQLQEAGATDEAAAAEAELEEATSYAKQLEQVAKDAADKSIKAAQKASDLKAAGQEVDEAKVAVQDAKTGISDAKAEIKTATERITNLTIKNAAKEEIDAAKAELKIAEQTLKDARQEAVRAVKALNRAVKIQATLAPTSLVDAAGSTLKSFAQDIAKAARTKVQNIIDETKSLGKSARNIFKFNKTIADDAAKDLAEKQAILKALPADATDAEKAAAQAEVDAAQKVADETKAITKETKFGKFKRLSKSALGKLGKVLKPVGLFMNVTFNMGNIIGGYNQDAKNALDLQTQATNLNNLWGFNNANAIATAQQWTAYLEEMEQKAQAQIGSQAIDLVLSQNILNSNIISLKNSIASALAPLYVELLTPNPTLASTNNATGLVMGNIGTSWKLQTQYLDLYPSQGFYTTTTGRLDFPFAQEIAQAPQVTKLLLSSKKGTDKLWFNQRCTARDNADAQGTLKQPTDPLTVQIDLQFLYTLESVFYTGLYLGGNYHDYDSSTYVTPFLNGITVAGVQQALFYATKPYLAQTYVNPAIVDFDEAHLAKMVVLYRDSKSSQLSLGVYEHEGLGWIVQSALPATLQMDQSHIYTMQATLNQTTLNIKLFVDGASLPAVEQSVTVTQSPNQRTYGIICSGAAIQWNQITPEVAIDTATRTASTTAISEIEQEKNNKFLLAQALTPTFGSIKLKAWSKQAILRGQYLYGTTDTDLKKLIPTNPNDLVVFGINQTGSVSPLQFGLDPVTALASADVVLISLINGTMYDTQGNSIGSIENVWTQYKAAKGPFSSTIDTLITTQQAAIVAALSNIKFGNFVLDIVTPTALSASQYIYTCTQTLQSAPGKPITDYLVCANFVDGNSPTLNIGLPPTAANANALFSFVSGNLYDKNTIISATAVPTPSNTTYQGQQSTELINYATEYGLSSSDPILTMISTAAQNYIPATPVVVKPKPAPITVTPVHKRQPITHIHFVFKGATTGLRPHAPGVHFKFSVGKKDLTTRQQAAAQKVKYQLYNSGKKKS